MSAVMFSWHILMREESVGMIKGMASLKDSPRAM